MNTWTCGHCGATDVGTDEGGLATLTVDGVHNYLCHPNATGRPDCYRLVTLYHHSMPCAECTSAVAARGQWTPGAGVERIKREMPHLIPAEISEEDQRRADEIIAAGNLAAAKKFFRDKLAYYDRTIAEDEARTAAGADGPVYRMLREQAARMRVYRNHLAVLLRTLGVDVPELPGMPEEHTKENP